MEVGVESLDVMERMATVGQEVLREAAAEKIMQADQPLQKIEKERSFMVEINLYSIITAAVAEEDITAVVLGTFVEPQVAAAQVI